MHNSKALCTVCVSPGCFNTCSILIQVFGSRLSVFIVTIIYMIEISGTESKLNLSYVSCRLENATESQVYRIRNKLRSYGPCVCRCVDTHWHRWCFYSVKPRALQKLHLLKLLRTGSSPTCAICFQLQNVWLDVLQTERNYKYLPIGYSRYTLVELSNLAQTPSEF